MSFHPEPTDSVPDETIVSRTARLCATLFATNGQFIWVCFIRVERRGSGHSLNTAR